MAQPQDTTSREEIALLRREMQEPLADIRDMLRSMLHNPPITREEFQQHEGNDERRDVAKTEQITGVRIAQAEQSASLRDYIKTRGTLVAVATALLVAAMTEIARVTLQHVAAK